MDRIVVFISGERGTRVVRALRNTGHRIAAVFAPNKETNEPLPDAVDWNAGMVRIGGEIARKVPDVNDPCFVAEVEALNPSIIVIAGYPQIFRAPLLGIAAHGAINLHAGRLPQCRGGSPLNWAIINGDSEAWLSVIQVDEGIDTGPILATASVPIGPDETIADLHAKVNEAFPKLVLEVLARLEAGVPLEPVPQRGAAVYWFQRRAEDGRIDCVTMTAQQAHNLVRAVTRPYPGAFVDVDGRRVTIWRTAIPSEVIKGPPGRMGKINGKTYLVCRDRALLVLEHS